MDERKKSRSPTISSDSTIEDYSVQSFEDLLKICGDSGIWQLKLFLLGSFVGCITALHNLAYGFIGAIPDHWCHIPTEFTKNHTSYEDLKKLLIPTKADNGDFEKCKIYSYHVAENDIIVDKNNVEYCSNYDYDHSTFKSTIATEWNLVCGAEFWASSVQAMYMFGILIGSPIFGALSDRFGRKRTILIATMIFVLAGPVVALAPNFSLVMLARFIHAAAQPGVYGTSFVLVIEAIGPEWRGLAGNLFCVPFAIGYMALPGAAYFLRSWRSLQLVLSAPAVFLFVTWWLLDESPRWLLRKGRIDEAEKILRRMASLNNVKNPTFSLPSNFRDLVDRIGNLEKFEEKVGRNWVRRVSGVLAGYANLLRTQKIRTRTLILYISWMSISMVYYGVALNAPNLSADRYIYTLISGVLEIPSYFMVPPLIKFVGRRPVFSGLLLMCGGSLLSSLIFAQGSIPTIVLALIGKLLIGSAYALIYLYATELLPTLLRTYGLGTASMAGRIGSATAPFIVDLLGSDNKTYPTVVFGIVSVIAGFISILLPETRNRRLPETISDIEDNNL